MNGLKNESVEELQKGTPFKKVFGKWPSHRKFKEPLDLRRINPKPTLF